MPVILCDSDPEGFNHRMYLHKRQRETNVNIQYTVETHHGAKLPMDKNPSTDNGALLFTISFYSYYHGTGTQILYTRCPTVYVIWTATALNTMCLHTRCSEKQLLMFHIASKPFTTGRIFEWIRLNQRQ